MPETLLKTKLYVPPLRPNLLPRPHLTERLDQGLQLGHKLTLVSAPAGFGKTTLVNEWVAACSRPAAWLSLDEGDNDPTRFLAYLIAALQSVVEDIGNGVLDLLQSPNSPPAESILTALLNEIASNPDNFILVLDDYHVIDDKPVDTSTSVDGVLTFLLEHLPPQMHIVIATREDPNLPLARMRAGDLLTELRVRDLRFSPSEAAAFFSQVINLSLSAEEASALETRTEGWIAGLQLAALSMRGQEDVSGFIRAFAGDNRYIAEYLVEEVLKRQPENVRSFLLQTSILEKLNGPLCDAVTGGADGRATLESLERGNMFVIPLDDKRQWYRYHHLFADILRVLMTEELPDQIRNLHRRASKWYQTKGLTADSVRHALAIEDFERAAGLVELAWPVMDRNFQSSTWFGWAKALPDEMVRNRPVLSAGYAWALLDYGELEASEARLRDAEQWLDRSAEMRKRSELPSLETSVSKMVVVDEEQFRSLPITIANARAYLSQALGDTPGSVKYSKLALDLLPEGDHFGHGRASVLLGIAHWASGDLESAERILVDAMAKFQDAGNTLFAISFTFILADIRLAQGRLRDAVGTYERSLQLATEHDEPDLQGTANLLLGLSKLHRELGDLDASDQYLLRSDELGDKTEVYRYRRCRFQAGIEEVAGNLDGALSLLDEAERWLFYRNPIPDVRPIATLKTRIWVAQGRLAEAWGWARERNLSVDDELSYMREFEHLTLATVIIAQNRSDPVDGSFHEALALLDRLLRAAEEGERTGSIIEILIRQAIAHETQHDTPSALLSLERALLLAEPEGYVRIFVDEGPPMAELLRTAAKHNIVPNYVAQLRGAFGMAKGTESVTQFLIEPLSKRELEVLRLLGTDLNGPEIARELMVSPNTMRTHTKNIYSKLGVHNRREAVRRAGELDLFQ